MTSREENISEMMQEANTAINLNKIIKNGACPRINEYAFADQSDEIKDDMSRAREVEKEILEKRKNKRAKEKEAKKNIELISQAMEMVLAWCGETGGWFGKNAAAIRTGKYDQLINGVDLVIEFAPNNEEEESRCLALSIAITAVENTAGLDEIMEKNLEKIKTGKLAQVKYFESPATGEKRQIENVIPVAIALDGERAIEFINKYSQKILNKKAAAEDGKQVGADPIQIMFLEQILAQLKAYLEEMDEENSKEAGIISEINKLQELLQPILDEINTGEQSNLEEDEISKRILKNLDKWLQR
ncbi:MAG: hypothetical protein PHD72_04035 [Patescibacteria group bacterium]|nr:hypothetical protein [Patescibacteria group bacterium]